MESVLSNFDIDNPKSFWKLYPSWKTPKIYHEFYKNDKSKGKDKSSKIMWGLLHMFEKSEANPYKNMDTNDKIDVINEDILETSNYNWDMHKDLMDFTKKIMYTEEERNLYVFLEFTEIRRKFIEETMQDLTISSLKDLDDAIKRNAFNIAEIERLRKLVELKADEGRTKGGIIESAMERGLI